MKLTCVYFLFPKEAINLLKITLLEKQQEKYKVMIALITHGTDIIMKNCSKMWCYGRADLSSQARRLFAAAIRSTTEVRKSFGSLRVARPS